MIKNCTTQLAVRGPPLRATGEGDGEGDTVYKALTSDGILVALKEVEITNNEKDKALVAGLINEINLLGNHAHTNIVQYRDYIVFMHDKDNAIKLRIYTDFVRHDTLETRYKEFELSERHVGIYTRHILRGIEYLHEKDIVHRDIRCANIWVDDQGVCKLVNFGKAKELKNRKDEILSRSKTGSINWMAPELVTPGQPYQMPVDIWSLGCTVLEMLTRRKPFGNDLDDMQVLARLQNSQGPAIPEHISAILQKFLKRCLQVKPGNRPTASDLLQDEFVREFEPSLFEQESSYDRPEYISVEDMCYRISSELERNASDSTLFVISTDWLEIWQSDDNKDVYTNLWSAGYLKSFETDTFTCFENVLQSPDGNSFADELRLTREYPNSRVQPSQDETCSTDTTPNNQCLGSESSKAAVERQIEVVDSGMKAGDKAGSPGEPDISDSTGDEGHVPKVSGTNSCLENCPHMMLVVTEEEAIGATSTDRRGRPEASTVIKFQSNDGSQVKVVLTVSCCVRGNQLCIKFRYLKGEIFKFRPGTVLRKTRLSVSAVVNDQTIILTSVDPGENQIRVCSKGQAQWDYSRGNQGNQWYGEISPNVQLPLVGGMGFGKIAVAKTQKVPVHICQRGDFLDLVKLKVGQVGCSRLDFKEVLVLERNMANTWLSRDDKDVTCVDSQADLNPIILTGKFDAELSSERKCSVAITCCAELDIDVIPEDLIDKKIKNEILKVVSRKQRTINLCGNPGHVVFKGTIDADTL